MVKKTIKGGDIGRRAAFKNIESIGFEIETTDLINLSLTKNNDEYIFINPEIYNCELEKKGCVDAENVYIVNEPYVKFKITTDTASDSMFNTYLKEIYEAAENGEESEETVTADVGGSKKGGAGNNEEDSADENKSDEESDSEEEDDEDDSDSDQEELLPTPIYTIHVPENPYLNQTTYDVFLKRMYGSIYSGFDVDEETGGIEVNSFTDTEYICTFYKPNTSKNVIKHYVSEMIKMLYSHISKLQVIHGSELMVTNYNDEEKPVENLPNQLYFLPNTTLCYYNSSIFEESSYNITTDLSLVLQMTFGVNVQHLYKTVKQLLYIDSIVHKKNKEATKFINDHPENKNVTALEELIHEYRQGHSLDVFYIDLAYNTVNKLVQQYIRSTPQYTFTSNKLIIELQSYLFIIFYQLIVYLNSYIENKSPLKFHLSFVFRHKNIEICSEIKRIIVELISSQLEGKSKEEIEEIADSVLIKIINKPKLLNRLYYSNYISNVRKRYLKDVADNVMGYFTNPVYASHIGNPLYSIVDYFEKLMKNKDYIIFAYTDSTIFPIKNNTVIVEFRDFPTYIYLDAFMLANNDQKTEIIKQKVGTLTLGSLMEYLSINDTIGASGVRKSKKMKRKNNSSKKHGRISSKNNTRKAF